MKFIHKIGAVVVKDNKFLVVRKKNSNWWTNLGGHPEEGESEEETLIREVKEEMGCRAIIKRKIGDFEAKAGEDDAIIHLSTYLIELDGPIIFEDPELEEYRFIDKDYLKEGFKVPDSIKNKVIPYCIENKILNW